MQSTDLQTAETEVHDEAREAMLEIAREVARFFPATGIDALEFERAFRSELVATLSESMRREGKDPTPTRIAVMSGLTRSAVEQAIANRASEQAFPRTRLTERGLVDGLATLTSLWTSDTRFTAMYGVPRDLPLRRSLESAESLELLADLAMPGVSFDRVLDALKEHDLVRIDLERSMASLVTQTVFFRTIDAQIVSYYGRMVAGLMRNLRINRERRLESAEDKPWTCSLVMDRPIAVSNVEPFLQIVAESSDRWFRNLESMQASYSSRPGEEGRRYAVCAFVSPDRSEPTTQPFVLSTAPLYARSMVTTNCIGGRDLTEFRRQVAESGQALLSSIDAEHKPLLAAPGQAGARLVVCCFLFDVTGSAETAEEAIDLLDPKATHRRGVA